jgi:hypothetical protein
VLFQFEVPTAFQSPCKATLRRAVPVLYNHPAIKYRGRNNGKSNQRASAPSYRAQASAVARGEVGSSNFRDRVFERYGNISHGHPTDPNRIGSFAAENGAGTKGEMGEGPGWIAASEGSDGLGSCKAHHVGVSPEEDRDGAAGEVGEVQSSEEERGLR